MLGFIRKFLPLGKFIGGLSGCSVLLRFAEVQGSVLVDSQRSI